MEPVMTVPTPNLIPLAASIGTIGRLLGGPELAPSAAPDLAPSAALALDQAEMFLLSLDNEMTAADTARAAYLLGLCEGHLASMIQLIRCGPGLTLANVATLLAALHDGADWRRYRATTWCANCAAAPDHVCASCAADVATADAYAALARALGDDG
jgi:hypothetical protein